MPPSPADFAAAATILVAFLVVSAIALMIHAVRTAPCPKCDHCLAAKRQSLHENFHRSTDLSSGSQCRDLACPGRK